MTGNSVAIKVDNVSKIIFYLDDNMISATKENPEFPYHYITTWYLDGIIIAFWDGYLLEGYIYKYENT